MMYAWGYVFSLDDCVGGSERRFSFLRIAVLCFLLEIAIFGDHLRSVGTDGGFCMDHVRQDFIVHLDRAQGVARDLGSRGSHGGNRSAGESKLS